MPRTAKVRQPDNSPYILIAGGAGFLGSHLTESLLLSGARVIAVDDLITGSTANIAPFKRHPRYEFIECNINQGLPTSLQDKPITHIVQAVGVETHANDQEITLAAMLTGAFGTKNLLDLAVATGSTFLLTSSISLYQGLASSTSLQYYYGSDPEQRAAFSLYEAKRYAEGLVEMYVKQYNLDGRIARLSQLYGPRMDIADSSFLDQLLQQVLAGQDLVVNQEGGQELYLTYVADAVYGLSRLLFASGENYRQSIYPLVNTEKISVLSVAYTLKTFLPAEKEVKFQASQSPNIVPLPTISIDRAKRDLDWEPNVPLTQGINQTVEYFKQTPPSSLRHTAPTTQQMSTEPTSESTSHLPPPTSTKDTATPAPPQAQSDDKRTSTNTPSSSTTSSIDENHMSPILAFRGTDPANPPPPTSNLQPPSKPAKSPSRRTKKAWWKRIFFAAIIFGIYLAWGQPAVHTTVASAYATYHLNQGLQAAKQLKLTQAEQSFILARQSYATASQQWQRLDYLARVLELESGHADINQTLQAAIASSEGLTILAHTAQPWPDQLKKLLPNDLQANTSQSALANDDVAELIEQTRQDIQQTQRHFGSALVALSQPQIPSTQVAGASTTAHSGTVDTDSVGRTGPLASFQNYIRKYLVQTQLILDQASQFLEVAPTLVGSDQPRRYLILLQNSNELRPTGGFTGSYIDLQITNGQLTDFKIDDIYNPDGQLKEDKPKASLIDKELTDTLPLRDANWYPDLPTSAKLISQRYHQATGRSVDGLIFVTTQAVKPLLSGLGSVYMQQYDKKVTVQNFDTLAQTYSNVNYVAGSTNKRDFLGQLAQTIFNRLTTDQAADWTTLSQAVITGLTTKEIQLYSPEPAVSLLINQHNWGGLTMNTTTDYLRVVDANVVGNKSNLYVSRSTKYDLNVDRQGGLSSVLTITWDHAGQSATWPGGDYVNYLRVYVPQGADLQSSKGFDTDQLRTYQEDGKQVFAGQVTLPYGKQSSVELRYALPDSLSLNNNRSLYQLSWQKQSGVVNEPLTVQFNTPTFLKNTNASAGAQLQGDTVKWPLTGTTDTSISATFTSNL